MSTKISTNENILSISITKRAQIGAVSGLVGGFAIFFLIFIIDSQLGQVPGTFYKIVGFPIGLEGISATIFGMFSHMATASLIGVVFCTCSGLHPRLQLDSTKKGAFAGTISGIVVYLLFFIPITMLVIEPLIEQGTKNDLGIVATISNIESIHLIENMNLVVFGAFEIHILFGVIMGFVATISMKQATGPHFHNGKILIKTTLAIILCTICVGIFYGIIAGYTPVAQQDELDMELSKIQAGLTYAELIGMNEDDRTTIISQMSQYSKNLVLNKAARFDKVITEDMSEITDNLESHADLKFLQSAQIFGVKGHDAKGMAVIVTNNKDTYLRLEDFAVTDGIDQHIYFTKHGDIANAIDIGKLKANKGNQNYDISGINPNEYNQVIIYSKPFDMYYASSRLAKIGAN